MKIIFFFAAILSKIFPDINRAKQTGYNENEKT